VKPYGSQEHGSHHDGDVDRNPDRQYYELAPHSRATPFCVKAVGIHRSCVAQDHRQRDKRDIYCDRDRQHRDIAQHTHTLPFFSQA
jgi:hypothetical protein